MNKPKMKPILLTISASGRVTFSEDVLKHLGVVPGGKIDFELLPDRRVSISLAQGEESTDSSVK